ncbi:MAG: pirin family protein [Alphaproteobacteria bacterium]
MSLAGQSSGPHAFRRVARRVVGQATSDGAGVRLSRVIGAATLESLDPFLLLDEFGSDRPDDYIAGFPDHPHRGMETVTYMLAGRMRHADNAGHSGVIGPGDVQWMSAARGIVHSEMPEQSEGLMRGFQLWVNLPAAHKMGPPRYQEYAAAALPHLALPAGGRVTAIAGTATSADGRTISGPVGEIAVRPLYLDISLAGGDIFHQPVEAGHAAFAYVFEGAVTFADDEPVVEAGTLAVLDGHGGVQMSSANGGRCLLIAGRPLGEPVARYGPFVMNTADEIRQAFADYQAGRF